MRYQIKRIDPRSVLKLGVVAGLVIGGVIALVVIPLMFITGPKGIGPLEFLFVIAIIPLRGIVMGLGAALGAVVYNWLVRWTGGVEVELEPQQRQSLAGGPSPLTSPDPPPPEAPAEQ